IEYDPKAKKKFLNKNTLIFLKDVYEELSRLDEFSSEEIEKIFMKIVERHNTKLGKVAQPVRVAVTGGTVSPGIFDVLEIVGKDRTLERLKRAMDIAAHSDV
ncbi:MAG: glutamate--tRNA ligase, partial [Nitrospirae bacterium]